MMLQSESIYSVKQVEADIAFLEYQCKKNQVALTTGTGIAKLIADCRGSISPNATSVDATALSVLFSVTDSLKALWVGNAVFTNQLRAMNTGNFAYGNPDAPLDHNFKDFEFEIFSASQLLKSGIEAGLPQHTTGEDLEVGDLLVQCKHPSTTLQVDTLIRAFTNRLYNEGKYGVFGMAVEDCLGYPSAKEFESEQEYNDFMLNHNAKVEQELNELYQRRVASSTSVLGLYTTASFFKKIKGHGARMVRMSNSVFCFRTDRKEIPDALYKQAYRLVSSFNPSPNWLTIEKQALK